MTYDARNVTTEDATAASGRTTTDNDSATDKQHKPKPELTKVSANIVPRAMAALELASELTGDSRTDVINRAIQVYAYLAKQDKEGKLIFLENPSTGSKDRVVFL